MNFFTIDDAGHGYGPVDAVELAQWQRGGLVLPDTVIEEAETGFRQLAFSVFEFSR